jgi:hypothetical protein
MLPPKKSNKKPSPAKKYKTSQSEVDWDLVRNINDNPAVQAAKMFDPTGISSYPDVYYAAKDLAEGKGSWAELGINVLGALPMVGKAKVAFRLAKAGKGSKTVKATQKVMKTVEKVAQKSNKIVNAPINKIKPLANSTKVVPKVIGKTAEKTEQLAKAMGKPLTPKGQTVTSKQITKSDVKNVAVDLLDIANVAADVKSTVSATTKKVKEIQDKKEAESYQPVPKKVVYYNTDSKRGEVEKAGTDSNVQYVPISNSAELKKWKEQKLSFGTGAEGLQLPEMFTEMFQTDPQETPAQKAAREAREARIAERAKLVAIQKAKNAARLAPIEAAQQKRYENWRDSSEDNADKTYDDWQEELRDAQKGPDVPQEGLEIGKAKKGYKTKGSCTIDTKIERVKLAIGTDQNGIMKTKMNPRKKYANGSNAKGVDPSNYIVSPAEAVNDYNIMLAKAEAKALSNPWLPVVSIVGGLAQQVIGMGKAKSAGGDTGGGEDIDASTAGDFVETAMGNNNVQNNVEVEGGEMYETPQGQVGEFQGPTHEEGGIPLEVGQDVEEGTKVYSDRLKVGKKTLAERKATRERQVANLEKIASDNLADQAVKNAAKRKMMAIEKEETADLDFQDKVNNMQKMADTMVEAFACGTGMKGIQKYDGGTGPQGIVYGKGYDESMFKDFFAKYNELNPGGVMDMNFIQGDLGMDPKTGGFGKVFGPGTYKASQDWLAANKDKEYVDFSKYQGDSNLDGLSDSISNNPNIDLEALKNFKIGEGINDNASLSYGDPYAKDGVNFKMPTETIMTPVSAYGEGVGEDVVADKTADKKGSAAGEFLQRTMSSGIFEPGNMTKLIGNYLGMTAGIKTAAEQRSTDVTHRNEFINAGKESQKLLDNAKQGIEINKAQAIVKATDVGRGGKRGGRNSARGVNQMRAMDWLYDTALQTQIADISAKAAEQISGIDIQKSSVALSADQLRGEGQVKANMANEAAKDAYYTALGKGRNQFAEGLMQTGKDLNDMKENKIIEGLMQQYGTYFTGGKSGIKAKSFEEITGGDSTKNSTGNSSKSSTNSNTNDLSAFLKSMNLTPDNKGYVTLPDGTKILEKDLLKKFSNK